MLNRQLELKSLVEVLGQHRAADLCRVHRTTVGRWLKGQIDPPEAALIALRAAVTGQMPGRDRAWDGWYFQDGLLWSPEGYGFDSGQILARVYERQMIQALRKQIEDLEAKLVAATRELAKSDKAANDVAVWDTDVRTKAYG